jgi:hypothetical protein
MAAGSIIKRSARHRRWESISDAKQIKEQDISIFSEENSIVCGHVMRLEKDEGRKLGLQHTANERLR